jgi:hypothetical protein
MGAALPPKHPEIYTTLHGVTFQGVYCAVGSGVLGTFQEVRKASITFVLSARPPHGTARLPVDGFTLNLIFECFWKICWEYSGFVKI